MSRRLRFIPHPMVVEVTCRTVQGRFLLQPSAKLNRLAIGILARAQRMYGMQIHAFCIMSNHYHLLLTTTNALQLARFMNFVQSNLAREAGRLARWRERFWGRRYQAILVSDEPAAQLSRLRYILSQGCKEGIVSRPERWRGAHCVRELTSGIATLHGDWVDRTAMYRAAGNAHSVATSRFTTPEVLFLSPLPCFEGVTGTEQRTWIRHCIGEIVAQARPERRARCLARRAKQGIEATQPLKRSRAPWFHVSSAGAGFELRVAYALFTATFRDAAERFKRGAYAAFPEGSFPPAPPYVCIALPRAEGGP
jgi:REP element-mobilizing transposase RayT